MKQIVGKSTFWAGERRGGMRAQKNKGECVRGEREERAERERNEVHIPNALLNKQHVVQKLRKRSLTQKNLMCVACKCVFRYVSLLCLCVDVDVTAALFAAK